MTMHDTDVASVAPGGTGAPLPAAPSNGGARTVVRAVGRALWSVVATAALLAAGLGGWFVAEQHVLAGISGEIEAGRAEAWPAELTGPATPWPVHEVHRSHPDGARSSMIVDPARDVLVFASTDGTDAAPTEYEFVGSRIAVNDPESGWGEVEWTDGGADISADVGSLLLPTRLPAVVPGVVGRYATVSETSAAEAGADDESGVDVTGISRWFDVTVDVGAFRIDDPVRHARSVPWVAERSGIVTWTIGVDDAGRIMRWTGFADGVVVSMRPVEEPDLRSPLGRVVEARSVAGDPSEPADS